jgi:GntR family transcriptional regulator, rspAB operon transcriptional repressor
LPRARLLPPLHWVIMGSKADRRRQPPESEGLAGEAYASVRERILRGEFTIGQVISRRKIAVELGMSFLPVSEALLRLEHEGLLESRPRAGTRVRVPTRLDLEGHYVVREALEGQAAMLFAMHATREERTELLRLAMRLDALSAQQDTNRFVYLSLHDKLHRRIAECGRCPALSDAVCRTAALALIWLCAAKPAAPGNPATHHEDLMKVLVSADPAGAAEAMRIHIRSSMANAMRRLEPFFRVQKEYIRTYSRTMKSPEVLESAAGEEAVESILPV